MSFGGSSGSSSIHGASDVALSNPADGQVLTYSGNLAKWQNAILPAAIAGNLVISAGNLGNGQTISLANTNSQTVLATANSSASAVSFSNILAGSHWTMGLSQDASGSRTVSWNGITWLPYGPPGLAIAPYALDIIEFWSPDGSNIYGYHSTPHVNRATIPYSTSAFVETFPRLLASTTQVPTAGTIYLTHFTPDRSQTISTLFSFSTAVAAGSGISGKLGIYQYLGSNNYQCVCRTGASTALWSNTAMWNISIADDGASSPNALATYTLQSGTEYAFATIGLGSWTTTPRFGAITALAGINYPSNYSAPRLGSFVTGQTDLPTTLSASSAPNGVLVWGSAA